MPPTLLVSFGVRHGMPPKDGLVIDIRPWFGRNPYHRKHLRGLRGDDPAVMEDILKTPDFEANYARLRARVAQASGTVYIGCTGGHHRSVYLVRRLAEDLGIAAVVHRDYYKP